MARSVAEWVGKSDDHRAPSSVRQRVFDREDSVCHLCGLAIQAPGQKWDLDHVVALINGGENRESNLKPAHRKCHKAKTAADVAEKAKVAAIRGKHTGATVSRRPIASRNDFPSGKKRTPKPELAPRSLYASTRGSLWTKGNGDGD